jgi:small subunit ribosomal protein S1
MIDETHSHTTPPAEPPVSAEPVRDEPEPDSAEFARALDAYERTHDPGPAAAPEPTVGSRVSATVVAITDDAVMLDVGGRSEAIADAKLFRNEDGSPTITVGQVLDLFVTATGEPLTLAPAMRAQPNAALAQVRQAHAAGAPIHGRVTAINAGGLLVDIGGVRGFCPFSQVESGFCADPSIYVGQTLEFLVTEIKDARGGAVLSRKRLLRKQEEESARQLIATLKPGDELDGKVARLEAFGAFIDLGGVDGLVHVSEIRHERTGHPREALREGQPVHVRVLKIDAGKDGRPRIGLSIKAAQPDPWKDVEQRYAPGSRLQGTVARLTDFGAFVTLEPGVDGLVHVSEVAAHRVGHAREVLSRGQQVEAVVLGVDPEKRRISLSIRAASGDTAAPAKAPTVGDVLEGHVAGIKPFGVFVDLPDYGRRVAGMIPREETGEERGADLNKTYTMGQTIKVEVIGIREGKIRLGLPGRVREQRPEAAAEPSTRFEQQPARPPRQGRGERPGKPERGNRSDRGERQQGRTGGRRDRTERDWQGTPEERPDWQNRPERHGRRDRHEHENTRPVTTTRRDDQELTTMAIALRKAMERAKEKDQS